MKQFYTFLAVLLFTATTFAQVGINTQTPDASAALDITSNTAGILIPRMTQSQRDAVSSPATGLMVYQTDNTPGFYYYGGSSWSAVASSALGFSDYIFEPNNQYIGHAYTGGQISTHTMSLNYSKKGYMKLSFSVYQGYNSGSGKIDVYDPNNNLIESIDISYGLVSASGVNETLRYWGGFMIEPDWSSLTLQIYHTGGSQGASVYLKSKEVVLFE